MRAWLESAAAGGVAAKSAYNRIRERKGISLREVMFTASRGGTQSVRRLGDRAGCVRPTLFHGLARE
jgi:hypothetical protein